jgi:hypothetical protein
MTAVLRGPDGQVKETVVRNAVTNNGKYGIMDNILASPTLGKPTHMAVGTSTVGADDLGAIAEDRHALTSKTRSNAVVTMVGDWAAGAATGTLTEAGVFDASTSGHMWLSAGSFSIVKAAADSLSISWALTGA